MNSSTDSIRGGHYFNKHRSSNPLHRAILSQYRSLVREILDPQEGEVILDVGCGEGDLDHWLGAHSGAQYIGCDFDLNTCREFSRDARSADRAHIVNGDGFALPFADRSFRKVACWQVLEHIPDFDRFLASITRVCSETVFISVPREPMWRFLNVCQGRYLNDWGNTPGHLNHWGSRALYQLLSKHLRSVEIFSGAPPFLIARGSP